MLAAKGRHVLHYLNNSISSALMKIQVIQKDFVAECHLHLAITSRLTVSSGFSSVASTL